MTDIGLLVEVAMSMRQFNLVETMLKSLPKEIARSASFRERYKVFMLVKWVANEWKTDDPHLVLATLLDNVPSSEADTVIEQAAAQILKTKIKEGMSMAAVNKIIDSTFPGEENFEAAKKKLVDISVEFASPTKVINAVAQREQEDFKRMILELAERMERMLPTLKVDVEMPQMPLDGEEEEEEERGEDEVTFTAAELREAFDGDWDNLIGQKDSDVQAFVLLRAAGQQTPLAAHKKAAGGDSKSVAKSSGKAPPPTPATPVPAVAPPPAKRKGAEVKTENKAQAWVAPAAPAAPSPASSGGGEGKRHRRFWGRREELDLVRGVRKYGKGSWKRILQDEGLTFEQRSATDLKDKWRNLEKRREEYERELDAMGEGEDEDARPAAPAARKPSKGGSKRESEEMEEVEDSDKDRVTVKKEPALKKQQQASPTASQIRESALEARKKRMQQLSGAAAGSE